MLSTRRVILVAALSGLSGLVGGVLYAVLIPRFDWHPQLGDIATWVTALVAVPAVYFALVGWKDQRDLQRRQLDREERMTALPVSVAVGAAQREATEPPSRGRLLHIRVLNQSDRMIFNVAARISFEHNVVAPQAARHGWLEHPASTDAAAPHSIGWVSTAELDQPVPSVGPGRGVEFTEPISEDLSQDGVAVVVRFTDEFGIHWCRYRDGMLHRLAGRDW